MNDIPINHLDLSILDEGIYEHETGIRINRRILPEPTDLHWHEFFEMEFIISGKGVHLFNGVEYELKSGSAFMLTPLDFHKVVPVDNLELCTIMFPDTAVDSNLLANLWKFEDKHRMLTLFPDKHEKFILLFNILFSEIRTPKNYSKKIINNILECLFISFLSGTEKNTNESSYFNTSIQKALSYLHANFRNSPSLIEAATISGYAPNYFSTVFKKITGKTYSKYLNDLRLNFAQQLIINSDLSLTEICFASGFESLANFYRMYKSVYGFSPKNTRVNSPEQ